MVSIAIAYRRSNFELFYYTHHFAAVFVLAAITHAWSYWYYAGGPILLWVADRCTVLVVWLQFLSCCVSVPPSVILTAAFSSLPVERMHLCTNACFGCSLKPADVRSYSKTFGGQDVHLIILPSSALLQGSGLRLPHTSPPASLPKSSPPYHPSRLGWLHNTEGLRFSKRSTAPTVVAVQGLKGAGVTRIELEGDCFEHALMQYAFVCKVFVLCAIDVGIAHSFRFDLICCCMCLWYGCSFLNRLCALKNS
jgi:hypothetical protein